MSGLFVFPDSFRRAGLQGIVEFDAIMSWLLKAKVMHLYNGVNWCNGFPILV